MISIRAKGEILIHTPNNETITIYLSEIYRYKEGPLLARLGIIAPKSYKISRKES